MRDPCIEELVLPGIGSEGRCAVGRNAVEDPRAIGESADGLRDSGGGGVVVRKRRRFGPLLGRAEDGHRARPNLGGISRSGDGDGVRTGKRKIRVQHVPDLGARHRPTRRSPVLDGLRHRDTVVGHRDDVAIRQAGIYGDGNDQEPIGPRADRMAETQERSAAGRAVGTIDGNRGFRRRSQAQEPGCHREEPSCAQYVYAGHAFFAIRSIHWHIALPDRILGTQEMCRATEFGSVRLLNALQRKLLRERGERTTLYPVEGGETTYSAVGRSCWFRSQLPRLEHDMRSQLVPLPVAPIVKVLQPAARHSWGSSAIFLISGFEYCLRISRLEVSLRCILALRYSLCRTRASAEKLVALLVEGAHVESVRKFY